MKTTTLLLASLFYLSACQKEKAPAPSQTATIAFVATGPTKFNKVYSFRTSISETIPKDSTGIGCSDGLEVLLNESYVFKYKNSSGDFFPMWGAQVAFSFYQANGGTAIANPIDGVHFYQNGFKAEYIVREPSLQCPSREFTFKTKI